MGPPPAAGKRAYASDISYMFCNVMGSEARVPVLEERPVGTSCSGHVARVSRGVAVYCYVRLLLSINV